MSNSGYAPYEVGDYQLFCGDNLEVLRDIETEGVGLVYLDPPFNTATTRAVTNDSGEICAFNDSFGPVSNYMDWIRPRLTECVRVLRTGGTIFIHCDWRTSHYLKVEMDALVGYECFVNEIVWKRHNSHSDSGQGSRHFGRNTDSILFYGKGERTTWNPQYSPYEASYVQQTYGNVEPDGRRYALTDITGPGGPLKRNPEFEFLGVHRAWRYSRSRLAGLYSEGRLVVSRKGGVPRRKRYLDEMPGKPVQSLWEDLTRLRSKERVGYPTQKPLALLDRIVRSSTQLGETVLDPFCGSGTTLVASAMAGRQAIGIDSSPAALSIARRRLEEILQRPPVSPQPTPQEQ
jgi:DNA modification methylase